MAVRAQSAARYRHFFFEQLEQRLFLHAGHVHEEDTAGAMPESDSTATIVTGFESGDWDSHLEYSPTLGKWVNVRGNAATHEVAGGTSASSKSEAPINAATGGGIHFVDPTPAPAYLAQAGEATTAGEIAQSAYTTGAKKILLIRVRFLDQYQANNNYEPASVSSLTNMLNGVDVFFKKNSFDATSIDITNSAITPVYTFANTASWYSTNDTSGYALNVLQDATALAANPASTIGLAAANTGLTSFSYSLYDQYAIHYAGGPGGFSGQAYVGSTGTWMKSTSSGVAAHEFGHNLGLWHANRWIPSQPITVIGPGSNNEYGENYDTMGGAGGGNNAFNAYEKWRLDWITSANVTTATSSGVYRVYAHDLGGTLEPASPYAIKFTKDADRDYWLSLRQSLTNNKWLMNGLNVHWDPWGSSEGGSHVLDTTPLSPDGVNDSAVVLGRTFTDYLANVHITPISLTAGALPYMDVQINFGAFTGSSAPTGTLSATATTLDINQSVTLTATGLDTDGDTLSYYWDFGDRSVGTNASVQTKAFSAAGDYRVRVVVSDMKGRSWSESVILRVGAPARTHRYAGTVTDANGQPLADVLVNNGLSTSDANYVYAYTDADGNYSLVGVASGSYTINAYKAGYTLSRVGFTNPVASGAQVNNINFSATINTYKISGKVTDWNGVGIAGVLVSDGIRTEPTNSSGDYTLYGVPFGTYSLTASKPGYTFTTFNATSVAVEFADATAINFTEATYTVSGQITGISAATNLSVTDGTRTATVVRTGNGGNTKYQFTLSSVPAGTWNLRVVDTNAAPGSYTPSNFSNPVTVTSGSISNQNFTKDATRTYAVAGTVTHLGAGLSGATVSATLGGTTKVGTTDARGGYYLQGLTVGTWAVSVSKAGFTFTPASANVAVSTANGTANFATTNSNAAPTVAVAASATPNPTGGTFVDLSALGADDQGTSYLLYTWSTTSVPSGASVTYTLNGANAARNTRATVNKAGAYSFRVTIRDQFNATVTSTILVNVTQTAVGLSLTPASVTVPLGNTQQFTATQLDQFGNAMAVQPSITWAASGGTVSTSGLFAATDAGSYTVTASDGTNSASAAVTVSYPVGTGTGITREVWLGVAGAALTNLKNAIAAGTPPSTMETLTSLFEAPSTAGDNYSQRIRGTFLAPVTGSYTFYIASDDTSELYISTDANPANKVLRASVTSYTSSREWTKSATQKSIALTLTAGQAYYIEALHAEGGGGDNLAVRVDLPGGIVEAPIPFHRLSPWVESAPTVAPTSLSANPFSSARVDLAWAYSGGSNSGFTLERAADSSFTTALVSIPIPGASTVTYSDTTVTAGSTYYYRLSAANAAGSGPASNVAFATTPGANQAPTLVSAASASPNPVTSTSATLSVLGADDAGETALTYSWSVLTKPAAALNPTFSINGSNAAKSTAAIFSKAGSYTFRVTITDAGGLSVTSDTTAVTVNQSLSGLTVAPANSSIANSATQQFSASGIDQFGDSFGSVGGVTWSLVAGSPGSINAAGLYTAPATGGGAATIRAVSGAVSGQTQATVGNVLFADNFEAGAAAWTVSSGDPGVYSTVIDGTIRYRSTHTNTAVVNRASAGSSAWTNYAYTATYKLLDNSAGGDASLLLRYQDDSHWYGFNFDKALSQWKIFLKNGSATTALATSATTSLALNTDYAVRAEVEGNNLRFYVNNVLQVSTTATNYATGKIGWSSYLATGILDNVAVFPITANAAPTVATPASSSLNLANTSAVLTVLGADDSGEATLTYSWSLLSKPVGAADPSFSINGTNAAKSTAATFSRAGSYAFRVTITDAGALSVTSDVAVNVAAIPTVISVTPASGATLLPGNTRQFAASALDQFNASVGITPTWSTVGGSISSTGLFTAGTVGGSFSVTATSGAASGNASVTVFPTTISGTSGPDYYTLRLSSNGQMIEIHNGLPTGSPLHSIEKSAITSLTFDLGDGNDTLTLDGTYGAPLGDYGFSFDGGAGTNTVNFNGGTYRLTNTFFNVSDNFNVNISANTDLIVTNGGITQRDAIATQIANARNGGAWDLAGITSTAAQAAFAAEGYDFTTLGVVLNSDLPNGPYATFGGQTVGANDVLVKYTWGGDTDLNGVVDGDDYFGIDNGFANDLSGWVNGDFDYNGMIDGDDYFIIDSMDINQSGTLASAMVLEHSAVFGESYMNRFSVAQLLEAGIGALPEDASIFAADSDIGLVKLAGSLAPVSSGVYPIQASGNDIWNKDDAFHFAYLTLTGDAEITARVTGLTRTDAWAKAGVMIRESLAAGSRDASVLLTPSNCVAFQRRTSIDVSTTNTNATGPSTPCWIKLVRTGNTFTAFRSADGSTWAKVGSTATIAMGQISYFGLAVTSHNARALTSATFDNVSVKPLTNLAKGKPATATSTAANSSAAFAVDGNTSTTWNSLLKGTQFLSVDLGQTSSISSIVLQWASNYATKFTIESSTDNSTWVTLSTQTSGKGGTLDLSGLQVKARYVRIRMTVGNFAGYGVSELTVLSR